MDDLSKVEEYKLYEKAEKRARQKIILRLHIGIYIGINSFLTAINIITLIMFNLIWPIAIGPLPQLWAFYPWTCWGLGFLIHIIVVKVKRARIVAFYIHAAVALELVTLLLYINIAYPPIPFVPWMIIPDVVFVGALVIHGIFTLIYKNIFRERDDGKSWYDRVIEKEATKIRKDIQKDGDAS